LTSNESPIFSNNIRNEGNRKKEKELRDKKYLENNNLLKEKDVMLYQYIKTKPNTTQSQTSSKKTLSTSPQNLKFASKGIFE